MYDIMHAIMSVKGLPDYKKDVQGPLTAHDMQALWVYENDQVVLYADIAGLWGPLHDQNWQVACVLSNCSSQVASRYLDLISQTLDWKECLLGRWGSQHIAQYSTLMVVQYYTPDLHIQYLQTLQRKGEVATRSFHGTSTCTWVGPAVTSCMLRMAYVHNMTSSNSMNHGWSQPFRCVASHKQALRGRLHTVI